jgi:hypothetical protein
MDLTKIGFLILLGCVGLERLVELQVSRRHQRELAICGARKQSDPQYRWMVALHAAPDRGVAGSAFAEPPVYTAIGGGRPAAFRPGHVAALVGDSHAGNPLEYGGSGFRLTGRDH